MPQEIGIYQKTESGIRKSDKQPFHCNKFFMPDSCSIANFYGDDLSQYLENGDKCELKFNVNWVKSSVYITEVNKCKS